jgi:hypothetical protein
VIGEEIVDDHRSALEQIEDILGELNGQQWWVRG